MSKDCHICHDDVIKWKHFPRYWPFVRGIHRSTVTSPHKGQWRGALIFSLICVWINGWVNNRGAGDLRRYLAHYDVTVMYYMNSTHYIRLQYYNLSQELGIFYIFHIFIISINPIFPFHFQLFSWGSDKSLGYITPNLSNPTPTKFSLEQGECIISLYYANLIIVVSCTDCNISYFPQNPKPSPYLIPSGHSSQTSYIQSDLISHVVVNCGNSGITTNTRWWLFVGLLPDT